MRRALQSFLSELSIHWDAEPMAINCPTNILNLSAKIMRRGLYAESSNDSDNDETSKFDRKFEATSAKLPSAT
jgi:hypothetical protein